MKKKQAPRDILIYTPFLVIMIMCIIDATFKFADMKYKTEIILGAVLITMAYLYISSIFKFGWILILAALIFPKPLSLVKGLIRLASMLPHFINSLIENYQVALEYQPYFQWYMVVLTVVVTIIFFFIIVLKKHTVEILILGYGVIGLYFLLGLNNIYRNANLFLLSGLALYGYNNYESKWKNLKSKKVVISRGYYGKLLASILVIVFLSSFSAAIFSKDKKPVDLEWVQKNFFEGFKRIGNGDKDSVQGGHLRFSISSTGYQSNPQRLGGPVRLNKSTALIVKGLESKGDVHLRGTIKDFYNGYMWDKSISAREKLSNNIGINSYGILSYEREMEIIHKRVSTSTIFNILYPYRVDSSWGHAYYDNDMELYNPKVIKSGKGYKISYKELEITREIILSKSPKRVWKPTSEQIRYMQLSSTIPQRVYDITNKITEKYNSPYEKVSAIENYLKETYKYDLNTSPLPNGRDFVDYFLFEENKGYCTYFATAMTVMCRIAGIPARYAEGFLISSSDSNKEKIEVLNSDAHAWVEVYFDNVGWVTFDPTPGNASLALDLSESTPGQESNNSNLDSIPQENQNERNEANNTDTPEEDEIQTITQENSWIKIAVLCGEIIIAIVLVILLIFIVLYIMQFRLLKKDKIAIAFSMWKIMLYGKLMEHTYKNGKTIREFIEGIGLYVGKDFSSYISICENNIYGKQKLTAKDLKIIKETVLTTKENAKKTTGWVKFHIKDFWNFSSFYIKNIKNCR